MKRFTAFIIMFLMIFSLTGCIPEIDSETLAIMEQYDQYRTNEFSDPDHFIDYMNTFSLETSHAGIHITVEYREIGVLPFKNEAMGIIVDEDTDYYYAVTDARIFDETVSRRQITVVDALNQVSIGRYIDTDYETGISIISFAKPEERLFVASLADAIPMQEEPVVLLSYQNDIRHHIGLGMFLTLDTYYQFYTNEELDDGVLGGGVFNVNQQLVGIIIANDGKGIALFDDILALLKDY